MPLSVSSPLVPEAIWPGVPAVLVSVSALTSTVIVASETAVSLLADSVAVALTVRSKLPL